MWKSKRPPAVTKSSSSTSSTEEEPGPQLTTGEPAPAEAEARPRVQFAPAPNPALEALAARVGARVGAPSALPAVPEQDSGRDTRNSSITGEAGGARPDQIHVALAASAAATAPAPPASTPPAPAAYKPGDARAMRAARKISAASGSMAHNNMLTELVAWRSALPNAENFVQPWATRRAPRSIEIRVNGAARVIQGKWRRRNLMREVDSGKDARKLLKRVDSLRNLETRRRSSTFDPAALGMSPCPSTPCSVRRERTDGAPFPSRSASAASAVSSTTSG